MTEQQYGEHGRCEATAKSTGERCKKAAIGPHGKCDVHGGKSLKGEEHPNFRNGATSEYFKSKLSERQQDVYDEMAAKLEEPESALEILRQTATRLILVGEHSHDSSMIREGRQLLETFNIVPSEDEMNVNVSGTVDHDVEVSAEKKARLDELLGGSGEVEIEAVEEVPET